MPMIVDSAWAKIARQAWEDIQPFPGRFGLSWRVALLCTLVSATAMLLKIPEAAISCYLVIFLSKQDAVQNCILAFGVILMASFVVLLMIPIINVSVDSPAMRLAVMFFASYVFLFLSSATPLGEQAAIVGLIIAFIMTLVTMVPVGEIADKGLLMAWKMACMPMFLMILFNLLFGTPSQTLVRRRIVERLQGAAERIEMQQTSVSFNTLVSEGNDASLQQMQLVKLLHLISAARLRWLNGAVETSYRILIIAETLPDDLDIKERASLVARLRQAADAINGGELPALLPDLSVPADASLQQIQAALSGLSQPDGGAVQPPRPRKIPMLAADAFSNPIHQRYALKTSAAAVLCYLIYTGMQWDGIHTAMITCYVAALGTTGETLRKLTLRIVGCLIGAALGFFSLLFLMPHLTSIGGLMGLVFFGVLIGAWVSSGVERIYYAGVQIALAFLLTTLNGFGPSFDFSQASDRIYGILLGIFVIYVIFTQFWPRSVVNQVVRQLNDALSALGELSVLSRQDPQARTQAASSAHFALGQAEELLDMAPFEPSRLRATAGELERLHALVDALHEFTGQLYVSGSSQGAISERLRRLQEQLASGGESPLESQHNGLAPSLADDRVDHESSDNGMEQQLTQIERIVNVEGS
ncbi:FUSC family protein [Halomonas halocynthiae]|uniref:FUSC family protein n=1 Tax=Halomonas halocynthiae TaxID=176290 RepID=UPI00040B9E53|nr:FUSC family protein [Halomonas halocynthiae]